MSKPKKPNRKLQYERELRGWSQQKLAEEIGTDDKRIGVWERGESAPSPFFQEKLCILFDKNAAELGLIDEQDDRKSIKEDASFPLESSAEAEKAKPFQIIIPQAPLVTVQIRQTSIGLSSAKDDMIIIEELSYPPVFSSESSMYMDYQRREFLQILGIASSALLLSFPLDWKRIGDAIEKPSRLDSSVMQSFEALNKHHWDLYLSAATKSLVLDGVLGQFKMLTQLLKEPHTSQMHQRLCGLSSDLSQLAGEIFFDRHEHDTAKACYRFAMSTAKEAKSPDLWASAVVRSSFLPLYEKQYEEALTLLKEAGYVAQHGDPSLSTQFWAAAVEAEAESGTGNLAACQDALDRAQEVLNRQVMNPMWLRFDGTRLPALRGACFVRLHQPDLALPILKEALMQFSGPSRRRGLVLADMASASVQCQEVEQACSYASEVVDIVALGSSGFLQKELQKLRQQLVPFAATASVKKLDQQIAALA